MKFYQGSLKCVYQNVNHMIWPSVTISQTNETLLGVLEQLVSNFRDLENLLSSSEATLEAHGGTTP